MVGMDYFYEIQKERQIEVRVLCHGLRSERALWKHT
jgi:hypothetical protein